MAHTTVAADSLTVIAYELGVSLGRCRMLADRVERLGHRAAATPLWLGLELIEESLLRLGVTFPEDPDHTEEHTLVLGVEAGVGSDHALDRGGRPVVVRGVAGEGEQFATGLDSELVFDALDVVAGGLGPALDPEVDRRRGDL